MCYYMQKISRHLFIHVGNARYFVLLPLIMKCTARSAIANLSHFVNKCQWEHTIISLLSSYLRACAVTINRPTVLERSIM
jgi:hypothetical protein